MTDRYDQLLDFVRNTEKLKQVYRAVDLSDISRRESSAEHSWHFALMLLLFEKDFPEDFDMLKAVKMAIIHDIVEIESGDVPFFDEEARKNKQAEERKAAKEIFGRLPDDVGKEFLDLFLEFEAEETKEAKFLKAFDRLHPMAMNLASEGSSWKRLGISARQVDEKKRPIMQHSELTLALHEKMFAEAKQRGLLK